MKKLIILFSLLAVLSGARAQSFFTLIGDSNFQSAPQGVCRTSDNGVLVPGRFHGQPGLTKLDSAGTLQWAYVYQINNQNLGFFSSCLELASGDLMLFGSCTDIFNSNNIIVVLCDNFGSIVWVRRYNSAPAISRTFKYAEQAADGSVYMMAQIGGLSTTYGRVGLYKIDPLNGNIIWDNAFRSLTNVDYYAETFCTGADNMIYAIGSSGNTYFLSKMDSLGSLQWAKPLGVIGKNTLLKDVIADGNDLLLTGFYLGTGSIPYGFVLKMDTSGTIIWQRDYEAQNGKYIGPTSIVKDAANNITLQGTTSGSGAFAVKTDNAGAVISSFYYPGSVAFPTYKAKKDGNLIAFTKSYTSGSSAAIICRNDSVNVCGQQPISIVSRTVEPIVVGANLSLQFTSNTLSAALQTSTFSLFNKTRSDCFFPLRISSVAYANTGNGLRIYSQQRMANTNSVSRFNCQGNCTLPVDSGLLLSTGRARDVAFASVNDSLSSDMGLPGDPDLTIQANGPTYDAATYTFSFCALTDSIQLDYMYASEDYDNRISATSDRMGIFLTGPGITGNKNIAIVPGSTQPAGSIAINNGFTNGTTLPTGPCNHCSFYTSNALNALSISYDGATTLLTAAAKVVPGQTYSLKLAVADVGTRLYDSGLLLKDGSFRSIGNVQVKSNNKDVTGDTIVMCIGDSATLSVPANFNYTWSNGETDSSINVTAPGVYTVQITAPNSTWTQSGSVTVQYSLFGAQVIQQGNTLKCSLRSPNYSYEWQRNGVVIPGQNAQDLTVTQSGCYAVRIVTGSLCTNLSDTVCVGISGLQQVLENELRLFPNPANNHVSIELPNGLEIQSLEISDLQRKVFVRKSIHSTGNMELACEQLPEGVYFIRLITQEGLLLNKKLIIQR